VVSIRSVVLCNGPDCKKVEDLVRSGTFGILKANYIEVTQVGTGHDTPVPAQGTVRHFCSSRCIANFYQLQANREGQRT